MFENDYKLLSFRGLGGLRVDIGASILLLGILFASLSQGLNPEAGRMFVILVGSALLAGFVQAATAIVQGVQVEAIALGGAGVQIVRRNDSPAADELLVAAALPVTHLALFALFGLASNVAAAQAGAIAQEFGQNAQYQDWRHVVEMLWLVAIVNFFLGFLHLLPAYPMAGGMLFHSTLRSAMPQPAADAIAGFTGMMVFMLWIPFALLLLSSGLGVFLTSPEWNKHMELFNNRTSA